MISIVKFSLYGILPGIAVYLVLSHRSSEKTQLHEMVTWSVLSHPIVGLLIFAGLALGISIDSVASAMHVVGLISLVLIGITLAQSRPPTVSWQFVLGLLGVLAIFIPMLSDRNLFAFHGFWHTAIANTVLAGQFPPENPGLAGNTISYVWFYHVWLAGMSKATGCHIALVNVFAHLQLVAAMLGLTFVMAEKWGYGRRYAHAAFWLLFGSINLGALIHFAPYVAYWLIKPGGFFQAFSDHLNAVTLPLISLTGTFLKIPVFYKSWSMLTKFYNVGAMAHGVLFFMLYVWALHRVVVAKSTSKEWFFYAMALLGLLTYYPVFIPAAALFASVQIAVDTWVNRRTQVKKIIVIASASAACGLAAIPYFLMIGSKTGATSVPVFSFALNPSHLWFFLVGPFWPLLPLVVKWLRSTDFRTTTEHRDTFIAAGLATGVICPLTIAISGGPSNYKYVYVSAIFVAWAAFASLARPSVRPIVRWLYGTLAVGPILLTWGGWMLSPWFQDSAYVIEEARLQIHRLQPEADALTWLARNSDKSGALIIPITKEDSKANEAYSLSAITALPYFVAEDRTWVAGSDRYASRKALIEYVLGSSESPAVKTHILAGPLYLILGKDRARTESFYNAYTPGIKPLAYFDRSPIEARIARLDLKSRSVFDAGEFAVLEISEATQGGKQWN